MAFNVHRPVSPSKTKLYEDLVPLAQALRAKEEEHPLAAFAAGFTPAGIISDAAALTDPDAPTWEKALSLLGPVGDMAKAFRNAPRPQSDITTYHGGERHVGDPKPLAIGGEGAYDEGPGFYVTPDFDESWSYAKRSRRGPEDPLRDIQTYDLPDEVYENQFLNLDVPEGDQPSAAYRFLTENPDIEDFHVNEMPVDNDIVESYQEYLMNNRKAPMQTLDAIGKELNEAGFQGVRTTNPKGGTMTGEKGVEYITVTDPSILRPLGTTRVHNLGADLPYTRLAGAEGRVPPKLQKDPGVSPFMVAFAEENIPDPENYSQALRNYRRVRQAATETNVEVPQTRMEAYAKGYKLSPEEHARFLRDVRTEAGFYD